MFVHHSHTPSRLDARTRLAAIFVPVVLISATLNPLALTILTMATIALAVLVKLTLTDLRRIRTPILIFCLVTLLMHVLFVHPKESTVIDLGFATINTSALLTGLLYCWRIGLFAILALSFVRWVTQEEFVVSVWRLLLPLGKVGVPAQGIGMALTIAVRFIPQILIEHRRIETAQRARGAEFAGSWIARTRQALPLLVPTVASAFRRIGTTADALTVRSWGVYPTRTFLRQGSLGRADVILLAALVLIAVTQVVI